MLFSVFLLFRLVPERVHFLERKLGKLSALRLRLLLHVGKAAHELVAGLFRRTLGIHLDKARDVRHREDEVADLLLDIAVAANRRADLGKLLLDLVERARNIRPVKADLRGLFLELLRTDEARQALGYAFERRGVGLLLFFLSL